MSSRRSFQSSVRINVGPNRHLRNRAELVAVFQSSVRINVGPNYLAPEWDVHYLVVSILRED